MNYQNRFVLMVIFLLKEVTTKEKIEIMVQSGRLDTIIENGESSVKKRAKMDKTFARLLV